MSSGLAVYLLLCLLQTVNAEINQTNREAFISKNITMEHPNYAGKSIPLRQIELKQLVFTNPYPEICSEAALKSKIKMRLCILEYQWSVEMPMNRRRTDINNYNFISEAGKFIPLRDKTDPDNRHDCLLSSRNFVREVPYKCYSTQYGEWNKTYWRAFVSEVINELRFTFDYILYDDTFNTRIEDKFWYLILYLKAIVVEIPNPYLIPKIIKSATTKIQNYKKQVEGLRTEVKELRKWITGEINKLRSRYKVFTAAFATFRGKKLWG